MSRGLFVGLSVLDVLYRLENEPQPNTKNVVAESALLGGGPSANAAVAFAALGGEARLVTAIGSHPMAGLIRADLEEHRVQVEDRIPEYSGRPAIASVMVSPNGDRLAASTAAHGLPQPGGESEFGEADVVLVDGHFPEMQCWAAERARAAGVPVVVDCGSWKPAFERLLPLVDVAICGESFLPPEATGVEDVFAYLRRAGVARRAITRGERSVLVDGAEAVPVAPVQAVDTLGAGDVFHGAFCFYLAEGRGGFREQLAAASRVAGAACEGFGTREWMGRWG